MTRFRPCRNHPTKWAQDGDLCRTCLRAAGDTRTTAQIQAQESLRLGWRPRGRNLARKHRRTRPLPTPTPDPNIL